MPNWKTYESSVRLLSAIVAAHPGLKLNYEDTAKYFGNGCTTIAMKRRVDDIKRDAKAVKGAADQGTDPFTVALPGSKLEGGSNDISTRFGGDCTKSAIENRFRRIKSDAKSINDAVAKGIDPITLPIGDTDGAVAVKGGGREISKHMGSDTTAGGIEFQFRRIKNGAKAQKDAVKNGVDPKDVDVDAKGSRLGEDTTPVGVRFQFSDNIKTIVKRQREALEKGQNPQHVNIDGAKGGSSGKCEMARCFGSDATVPAIRWQLAVPIKAGARTQLDALEAGVDPKDADFDGSLKEAQTRKSKGAKSLTFISEIAAFFGSDATAIAISQQFQKTFRAGAKLQADARTQGLDPKDCDFQTGLKGVTHKKATARYMGTDVTGSKISDQFNKVFKAGGKLQQAALDAGEDPKDIDFVAGLKGVTNSKSKASKKISKYYPEATASALDHRFRPIKKEAIALRAAYAQGGAAAVADKYGEGVTDNGGTPKKAKATPKKAKKNATVHDEEDEDASGDEDFGTPSKKKSALNKVKGGRVTKGGRGKANGGNSASNSFNNGFDDVIKTEHNDYGAYENSQTMGEYEHDDEDVRRFFPDEDDEA